MEKRATIEQEAPSAPDSQLSTWRLAIIISTLFLGAFLYGLDANIIGTAIPRITTDFKSLPAVAWYGASYLLTVTAFQPLFGNMYKFFNSKIVYLASLFIFEGILTYTLDHFPRQIRPRQPGLIFYAYMGKIVRTTRCTTRYVV